MHQRCSRHAGRRVDRHRGGFFHQGGFFPSSGHGPIDGSSRTAVCRSRFLPAALRGRHHRRGGYLAGFRRFTSGVRRRLCRSGMNQRHCCQPGHRAGRHRGRFLYRRRAVNGSGRAAACHRHILSIAAALRNGRSRSGHIGVGRSPAGGLFFSLYHRMHQRSRS